MKFKLLIFAIVTSLSLSCFTSCKEEDPIVTPVKKNTIVDVVIGDANFSFLKAAVVAAGLDKTLAETANLTVFAPTNQAFKNAGFKDEAAVSAADKATLVSILSYHVYPVKTAAADIKTGDNQPLAMLSKISAYLTRNAAGVSINGANVTKADVAADNGIIHVIDAVLTVPTKTIVELVVANPDLTLLETAVLTANTGATKIVTTLSGPGPLTVFAPTDAAFKKASFDDAKLKATDANLLAKILLTHAVGARVFSTNLVDGFVKSAQGGDLLIKGATVKGPNNAMESNITGVNIIATNGVIHIIDAVLLPK
jgi:uncharacterized surface protein with fasciclin (FAS1) repeats